MTQHYHFPKIIAHRPGLFTLRCFSCGAKWLQEYDNPVDKAQFESDIKKFREQMIPRIKVR
jgi:hypothetical protein